MLHKTLAHVRLCSVVIKSIASEIRLRCRIVELGSLSSTLSLLLLEPLLPQASLLSPILSEGMGHRQAVQEAKARQVLIR